MVKDRYKIEYISNDKKSKFQVICTEDDLERYKDIAKQLLGESDGVCYYRKFPLTKAKKIFFVNN